jgi:nucleoside phosphorylase
MTQLAFHDPCLLFAFRRESRPFLKEFRPHQRFPGAPCWARFCGPSWLPVLVLETGIGPARMQHALTWLLSQPMLENVPYQPQLILSAGFSGALTAKLCVGDVLLATEVADEHGTVWPVPWPGEFPPGEWHAPLQRGRLVSLPRIVGGAAEKQALGQKSMALAVDMETATVARLCQERQIPFGCVRTISDDVHTSLSPQLISLLAQDRVSLLRALATLASSPRLISECWRLARQTRLAAQRLGQALDELLTITLPWEL